jgi:two-component system, cell cycle sensor histidine kinase and response regulator CckA
VKGHGGMLDFESRRGLGTTFTVCLPAIPQALRSEASQDSMPPSGRQELILVVDDETSVRLVLKQTLEQFGYRVLTAADGAGAIATYSERKHEVSLVVTDMMMPGMDGSATIRALKAINPSARIIAASGMATDDRLLKASEAGAIAFLRKPYTAEMMLRTVSQVLTGAAVA